MTNDHITHRFRLKYFLQHLVFWIISLVLFTILVIFTREFRITDLDLKTTLNILVTVSLLSVSVYINLLLLIPWFFNRKRYGFFILLQLANIVLFIVLNSAVSLLIEKSHPDLFAEAIAEFFLVLIFLTVSTLLKFMRDSISLQDISIKLKEIEKARVEGELKALKAQINPHFFFNTLNSLYSLSLMKSDKTPEMILKLSELMRFIIYESGDEFVPMEKQLDFIKNYIYIEQLRLGSNATINLNIQGDFSHKSIAPLIFIPFVENAFKHGIKSQIGKAWVDISFVLLSPHQLHFTVKNNKEPRELPADEHAGLGLINVKKRLALQYAGKHTLTITDNDHEFTVSLIIELT